MKKLLLSFFIIFLSMNILAHDSEISRTNEIIELFSKLDKKPAAFKISNKTCDAEFIRIWLSTSEMSWSHFNDIVYPHICEELIRDPEINITFVKIYPHIIRSIDPKLVSNYDKLAIDAVLQDTLVFQDVKPEELSNPETYDKIAEYAVYNKGRNLNYVKPEELSNPETYDKIAEYAVYKGGHLLSYADPEHLNNYDKLVKIAMDDSIDNVILASISGVYNLEKTKRRDLLNYIKKSSKCNFIDRNILRNCKYNQKQTAAVVQWLKRYDEYEKEQEVN